MYVLISMIIVIALMIILIKVHEKRTDYIYWGLGIDCISYYSSRFTVSKQGVIIIGYQEILDQRIPIQYSVVKQNWWGQTTIYGQTVIYGNYKDSNCFKLEFSSIPLGMDYQIKIKSQCNVSKGKFKIILNHNSSDLGFPIC